MWTISLTSFTCMYTVVTSRIIVWTRWYTKVNFFFYSVMSIFVYIGYLWFSDIWSLSVVRYSVVALHESPLFYLTVGLIGGFVFCLDIAIEYFRITYNKNGSDYVREFMKKKKYEGWNDLDVEIKVSE